MRIITSIMPVSILPPAPPPSRSLRHHDSDDELDGMLDDAAKIEANALVTPGELVTDDPQWMRYLPFPRPPLHPTSTPC